MIEGKLRPMSRTRSLFRYSADARPVALIVLATFCSLSPFLLTTAHVPTPWGLLAALWITSQYVRTFAPYAQHNQGHLYTFNSRVLNTIYDALLTQVTGYPTAFWELQHNRGHHRHYLTPAKDPARIVHLESGRLMS